MGPESGSKSFDTLISVPERILIKVYCLQMTIKL